MADDPRLIHIEGRVDRLETDVLEIKSGVQKLLDRPQNPGLQQVLGTLVSTLVVCGMVFGFAEWRLSQAVLPVQSEITTLKSEIRRNDDTQRETQIQSAILNERTIWLKSQEGWKPKIEP